MDIRSTLQTFFKRTLIICLFLFIPLFINEPISAQTISGEHIENYTINILIKNSAKIEVTEVISYYFSEPRHGIFRNIPYKKTNSDGKTYVMDIDDISVSLGNSAAVPFTTSKDGTNMSLKIGDPSITVSGSQKYIIKYTVSGAITYFSDHDELYWNGIGNDWQIPISSAIINVTAQADIEPSEYNATCFTGSLGSNEENCAWVVTNTPSISFQTTTKLDSGEGFTIALGFPKNKVAVLEPKEDKLSSIIVAIILISSFIYFIVVPLIIVFFYTKEAKNVKTKQRIVAAWFSPPKDSQGKDYSPAETGLLYSKKIDNRLITATLINLAQRGFIKIKIDEKNKVSFFRTDKNEELDTYENSLLDGIFHNNGSSEVTLSSLKTSKHLASRITDFKSGLNRSIKDQKLFKHDLVTYSSLFAVLGGFGLMTFNFLLTLFSFLLGRKMCPRTDDGIQKYSEAVSLRNFLVSQDEQLDFQAENQMWFEKLLSYATAFGVEDIWIKRFGNLNIQAPDWYEGDIARFYALSAINHNISDTLNSATISATRSSSGFSSVFSGGSSGGGGGGGGG